MLHGGVLSFYSRRDVVKAKAEAEPLVCGLMAASAL